MCSASAGAGLAAMGWALLARSGAAVPAVAAAERQPAAATVAGAGGNANAQVLHGPHSPYRQDTRISQRGRE